MNKNKFFLKTIIAHWLLVFSFPFLLHTKQIDTFYGPMDVQEPVLLELIECPAFQRLKFIHQYGVSYYTTHPEEYNRYDHSLGVFAILRAKGSPLKEQIAGLLHDVSHTVFSHVGDWIYGKKNQEKDYQNTIHAFFLEQCGIAAILEKYGYTVEQMLPKWELFPALECPLPSLCADRIDYNIQGAVYQKFITYEEALTIFDDLKFVNNMWVGTNEELLKKLTRFSFFMSKDCWGSPLNYVTSQWLAEAILRAVDLGSISHDDIQFGIDQIIWDMLLHHDDVVIQNKMTMISQPEKYYALVSPAEADFIVKSRFRGIDPWIVKENDCLRITSIDPFLKKEYNEVKQLFENGWGIKMLPNDTSI